MEQGIIVGDSKLLASRCLYKKSFYLLDLASVLPIDLLFATLSSRSFLPIIRANRLLKLNRALELQTKTETSTNNPFMFRICTIVLVIFLIIHWNASIFYCIHTYLGAFDLDIKPFNSADSAHRLDFIPQYAHCFYRATLQLTTISNVPAPETTFERFYMIVIYMIGLVIFAVVVGSVTDIIDDLRMKRSIFQKKVDGVKSYMAARNVNADLQERVLKWFDNSWTSTQGLDERLIFQEFLPSNLQAEIAMNIHMQSLKRVHIFQDCEPGLLQQLVTKLKLQVFSPGDFVCRKGDIGREMYFIKSGRLVVVSDDGEKVFANLGEGSFFGEISILDIPGNKTGNRRTANVKSVGYANLFCLTKNDLWQVLAEYPLARKTLLEKGKALLRKDDLLDEAVAGELERMEEVAARADERLSALKQEMSMVSTRCEKFTSSYKNALGLLKSRVANEVVKVKKN